MKNLNFVIVIVIVLFVQFMIFTSCNSTQNKDSKTEATISTSDKLEEGMVFVYNFHTTNRCPSCIAIEEGTTKTIKEKFSSELEAGKIKQFIINVDDEKNQEIAEKYQAFGSGLFVTGIVDGKEKTIDLTGDGFKYARKKQDQFIEILSTKISELL